MIIFCHNFGLICDRFYLVLIYIIFLCLLNDFFTTGATAKTIRQSKKLADNKKNEYREKPFTVLLGIFPFT